MGKMQVIFKVTPKDFEKVEETVEGLKGVQVPECEFKDSKVEEIGFGVKVVKALYLMPEKKDELVDELTKAVQGLESVEEAEVEALNLL